MTYFHDIHTYLHQSSLLLQAYPQTTRITTKYSLPRKPKPTKDKSTPADSTTDAVDGANKQKRDPSATLTLKTFHPESGICLKYKTDKAAEVARLMIGLGRLAKGEVIDLPTGDGLVETTGPGEASSNGGPLQPDKMEIDSAPTTEAKTATQSQQQQGASGKKKKKNKK